MKIRFLGNTITNGDTITKQYLNTTSGSAYKKVPCDILIMHRAGFKHLILECNSEHPYLNEISELARLTWDAIGDDDCTLNIKKVVL